MKIGIITIHSVYNYGAVFQAYALKEYLKTILSDKDIVNVIDYRPKHFEGKKKISFSTDIKADLIELERLLMHSKRQRREKAFEDFINANDSLSEPCKDSKDISELSKKYDVLISGSDQIWNFTITGGDKAYLLDIDGYSGCKMSFASSLGNFRFYKNTEDEIKGILDGFCALSCRESDGCEYLKELLGKDCTQVCDPTLLLDAEKYLLLCKNKIRKTIEKDAEERFLLIYNLHTSDEVFEVAEKVSGEGQLKVYQIFPSLRKNSVVDKLLNDISPEEFLYLYSKAEFVVTNSFHGTCFSIINRKNFYTVKPTGSNNRLESLLKSAGLSDRLLTEKNEIDNALYKEINYYCKENLIKEYREKSENYLKKNLLNLGE